MKTQQIINQTVSVFKSAKDSDYVYYNTPFIKFLQDQCKYEHKIDYLRKLNKTDEKAAKEYKKENLIACTPSAKFIKRRLALDAEEKTGIIIIDIDKDKNLGLDIKKAKEDVMRLPYVFMTMLSCRGEGIWAGVYYNKDKYIGYVFNALKEDFRNIGYVIDDCKDLNRLRFISYDDEILIKEDVELYDKQLNIERDPYECTGDWELTKDDIKDIVVCVYVLVYFNDYTSDDYDEWLLDGFRLATLPNKEVGLRLFKMISEHSDNYVDDEDVEDKFEECYRTTTYTTNILGYYINRVKDIYGYDWRYRVSDLLKEKGIKIY